MIFKVKYDDLFDDADQSVYTRTARESLGTEQLLRAKDLYQPGDTVIVRMRPKHILK